MARVAAQYAYMVSSDFESPEARYALGPYTPVDPGHLHMKQPPRYTVNHTHIYSYTTGVLPSCIQFIERAVFTSLLSRLASRPQPVGSLPLAQNA